MSTAKPPSSSSHRAPSNTCQVTRAVQTMSSIHQTPLTTTFRDAYRFYFYSPKHFPKILGGIMLASGVAGYTCMGWWHGRKMEEMKQIYVDAYYCDGEGNGSRLASLARKMTRRIVNSGAEPSGLQRQGTKFW